MTANRQLVPVQARDIDGIGGADVGRNWRNLGWEYLTIKIHDCDL